MPVATVRMLGSKMMSSGGKADFVDEDAVGALADADFLVEGGGLALLVEGHDDDGGAVLEDLAGVFAELLFAFFERDGVDDAFPLKAFEAGFDDLPLGGIDHEGNFGDFGLGGEELEEAGHGGDAVDHALVHADVDDVGSVFDLLARDGDGFFVLAFLDEAGELGRAGDVGALADEDEDAGLLGEGLRAGETQGFGFGHAPTSASWRAYGRGSACSRALAMAAMCSGVLPQQPPAMLMRPA